MGIMDRVKPLANQVSQKTQEAAREGKARLDQAQANRQADVLLRNLGALVYAERTGRGTADTQAEINKQIADIQAHLARVGNQNFVHAGRERLPQPLAHTDKRGQRGGEHEPGVPDHQAEAERLDGRCGRSRQRTH